VQVLDSFAGPASSPRRAVGFGARSVLSRPSDCPSLPHRRAVGARWHGEARATRQADRCGSKSCCATKSRFTFAFRLQIVW
jgi:hypothetical protein